MSEVELDNIFARNGISIPLTHDDKLEIVDTAIQVLMKFYIDRDVKASIFYGQMESLRRNKLEQ